jgi:hypothetical protein
VCWPPTTDEAVSTLICGTASQVLLFLGLEKADEFFPLGDLHRSCEPVDVVLQ